MLNLEVLNGVRLLIIQASKVHQEGPLVTIWVPRGLHWKVQGI